MTNCYATGNVTANQSEAGGLVGCSLNSNITNCYANGSVTTPGTPGGLIAHSFNITVTNSYWDTETSGQTTSAEGKGEGKTTAEMMVGGTFIDWDFATIWEIDDGISYPRLR